MSEEEGPDSQTNSLADNITQATGEDGDQIIKEDVFNRAPTEQEIYRLQELFASFIIWNANDLSLADKGREIQIKEAHSSFLTFEFEVCIVATPDKLYDHGRGVAEAVQTARAMADYIFEKGWDKLEFSGYDKMARAAWHRNQENMMRYGYEVEVVNFTPPEVAPGGHGP